jgi:hypothetical protein
MNWRDAPTLVNSDFPSDRQESLIEYDFFSKTKNKQQKNQLTSVSK